MAEVLNTIRMEEESHDSVISPAVFSDPELEVTHEPASTFYMYLNMTLINRPGVAGAVLNTLL